MSYARMGCDGSDVYVYWSARDEIICEMCSLSTTWMTQCSTPWEMVEHLRQHIERGERVPYGTFCRLEADYYEEEYRDKNPPRKRPFTREGEFCPIEQVRFVLMVAQAEHVYRVKWCAEDHSRAAEALDAALAAHNLPPSGGVGAFEEREVLEAKQRVERIQLLLRQLEEGRASEEPDPSAGVKLALSGSIFAKAIMPLIASVEPIGDGHGSTTRDQACEGDPGTNDPV